MKKFILILSLIIVGNIVWASDAQVFKLDNGQTVVIQQVRNNPIVTVDTWIRTGSIDETEANSGVAHFLEHLFFKGTKTHEPGDFDKILETKGAITNAATSKDFTHYYITIPSKYFDLAMELHADMLLNPMIPRNEMEKERKVVLEEISKDQNSPNKLLMENLDSMLYTNHPYKRRVIGKSEVIETITRDQVLNFYNSHYGPANMITIIIGDVDTARALDKAKQVFNQDFKKPEKNIYPKELPLTKQQKKVSYSNVQSGYMLIGFRGTPITNKDSYVLDVLATILGDGRSSVLNQVLKEKKRVAFSVSAGNTVYRDDGVFYINANFEPEKCKFVQDAIFEEISKIQKNGITDEQLKLAKNIIERNTYYARESISNISSEIGYTMALSGDIKYYDSYLAGIKNVSKEEVKKAAEKYLGVEKSAVSIVLPQGSDDIPVSAFKKRNENGGAELVSKNSQTQKYKLSNGAIVLYTENKANDIIAMSIYAKGGQLVDKKGGTSNLVALGMTKGTKKYSSLEWSQVLEDNGIKISPSVNADTFVISVLTTKDEYDKTLELLDEIVNNASFDEIEIGKLKSDKLNQIKANKDIPLQRALDEYRYLIFKDSPYTMSSKILEQNIPNITRDDMIEYYCNIFEPENLVISLNGNIDIQKTIKELNNIFPSKNGKIFSYNEYNARIPYPSLPRTSIQKMPSTQTAWIMLGWQTDGVVSEKDYAVLQVIDSLLGSGMSSRLFKDLREQQGLAYQLGSGFSPHKLRGSFVLYIGTNPASLEKSKEGLFDEIKRLKTEYVGDKELKEAKEKLLGNYLIGLETNLDKASNAGGYEALGLGYEFNDRYEALINSVTDSDIIEVANKYFKDNYILSIVTQ